MIDSANPSLTLAGLCFEGPDAATFLQGYLTSDTATLAEEQGQPTALTTLKGRVLANGWALKRDNGVLLVLEHSLLEPVADFLKKYLAFSKTKVSTVTAEALPTALGASGLPGLPAPSQALEGQLIASRFALVSAPVSEAFLPQMLGLTAVGAVNFHKGCYLGQEVVARAEHRGAVKRKLTLVHLMSPGAAAGTELKTETGRPAGTLIVVEAASGQALAVLSAQDETTTLRCQGALVERL